MIRYAIYAWAALACASLVFYAITGNSVWAQLDPQTDGAIRLILLMLIHIGWIPMLVAALGDKT